MKDNEVLVNDLMTIQLIQLIFRYFLSQGSYFYTSLSSCENLCFSYKQIEAYLYGIPGIANNYGTNPGNDGIFRLCIYIGWQRFIWFSIISMKNPEPTVKPVV